MPYCNGPFTFLSPSFPDLSPCFQSALHVLITLSTILTVLGSSLSLLGCVNRSHSGSTCISIADPAFVSGSNDSETEREHGHGHNGTMEVFPSLGMLLFRLPICISMYLALQQVLLLTMDETGTMGLPKTNFYIVEAVICMLAWLVFACVVGRSIVLKVNCTRWMTGYVVGQVVSVLKELESNVLEFFCMSKMNVCCGKSFLVL